MFIIGNLDFTIKIVLWSIENWDFTCQNKDLSIKKLNFTEEQYLSQIEKEQQNQLKLVMFSGENRKYDLG
jgi:hypothetical protein